MEYHWTTKVRKNTLFFVFQSVNRANTVNMNAPTLAYPTVAQRAACELLPLATTRMRETDIATETESTLYPVDSAVQLHA
jgi:hypothetical protein